MDNLDIRNHIINNFKGDNIEDIKEAVEECIKEHDEVTLPGMGVFLEIIWKGASDELKNAMLRIIEEKVNKTN